MKNRIDEEVQDLRLEMEVSMTDRAQTIREEEKAAVASEIAALRDEIDRLKDEIETKNQDLAEEDSRKDRNEVENLRTQLREAENKVAEVTEGGFVF